MGSDVVFVPINCIFRKGVICNSNARRVGPLPPPFMTFKALRAPRRRSVIAAPSFMKLQHLIGFADIFQKDSSVPARSSLSEEAANPVLFAQFRRIRAAPHASPGADLPRSHRVVREIRNRKR